MKAAEWKRLVRPLLPEGARWEFRGTLCYRAPVKRFAFGVLAEGSGFDTGVYIWRVSLPLFVPTEVIVLSYSQRLGGGSRKYDSHDAGAMSAAIVDGFRDLPSEGDEYARLSKMADGSPNLRLLEAAACSRVLLGDASGALDTIRKAGRIPTRQGWETDVATRLLTLGRTLDRGGLDAAAAQLDAQAERTAAALGLVHE